MQNIKWIDLGGVNSYLIENEGQYLLIDTGGHMFADKNFDDRKGLLEKKLDENGVTSDNLKMLILTHGDCDHTNNAAYIQKKYHALVAISHEDSEMITNPEWDCYKQNTIFASKVISIAIRLMNKKIEGLMKKVYQEFQVLQPDLYLEEGMDLEKYGFDGKIYSTPGHTPGSICMLDSNGNLFCGDMFSNNKKPTYAMNAQNFELLREQAKRMLSLPVKKIYPGHGAPFDQCCMK